MRRKVLTWYDRVGMSKEQREFFIQDELYNEMLSDGVVISFTAYLLTGKIASLSALHQRSAKATSCAVPR